MQNQPPILLHKDTKSPKVYTSDPKSFKWTPLIRKLDKIVRNFCFDYNLWFSVVFE